MTGPSVSTGVGTWMMVSEVLTTTASLVEVKYSMMYSSTEPDVLSSPNM